MTKNIKSLSLYSILFICITFLFVGTGFKQNQEMKELWNLGHFILFSLLACLPSICKLLNKLPLWQRLIVAIVFSTVIAGIIEAAQLLIGRSASAYDIFISVMGAIASIFVFTKGKSPWKYIAAFICFLLASSLFIISMLNYSYSKKELDVEIGLSKPGEFSTLSGRAKRLINQQDKTITVIFDTSVYSTIYFRRIQEDWSKYKSLRVELSNLTDKPFQLVFDVKDHQHFTSKNREYTDRYAERINIKPGKQVVTIPIEKIKNAPLGREMDMTNIREFMLATYYVSQEFTVIFHSMNLVP